MISHRQHRLALIGLFVLVVLAGIFWSLRSLGYPDPAIATRSTADIASLAARSRQSTIVTYVFECLDATGTGKPAQAIKLCNRALALDPHNATALRLRGNAYMIQRDMVKAIADFTSAIKLAPGDVDAYRFRGMAYYIFGQQGRALADFSKAVSLNPSDPLGHQARGFQYEVMGKFSGAIDDFSFAIALDPGHAEYWNARCWALALWGRHLHQALEDCNQAIALKPGYAYAFDSRGLVLLRLARYSASVQSYTAALRFDRKLASAFFGRGTAKAHLGNPSATADLATARKIEPGIEARFQTYGVRLPAPAPLGT